MHMYTQFVSNVHNFANQSFELYAYTSIPEQ